MPTQTIRDLSMMPTVQSPLPGQFCSWLMLAAASAGMLAAPAAAQTKRATENPGWEENDPPGDPSYRIYNNADVPGWDSTTGSIEIWDSGFQGVPAAVGAKFAELNANQNGSTYQDICLIGGDDVNWAFYHRNRSGGPAVQNVSLEIASTTGTVLQTLATSNTTNTAAWDFFSGTTPFTGATGVYRFQFTTTNTGSYGNFLDGLDISVIPSVEFALTSTTSVEGEAAPNLPKISISGRIDAPIAVTVQASGGTATLGNDYQTPTGTNTWTVTIPAGTYVAEEFDIGVTVLSDSVGDNGETIDFTLAASANVYDLASTQICGAAPVQAAQHTITESADLRTIKSLISATSTPVAGDTVTFQIATTNDGPSSATSVVLSDLIPAELTATTGNGAVSQGVYDDGTGVWSIGTLGVGDTATLTVEGTVNGGNGGATITNTTSAATGDQPDPATTGDDLTEAVTVTPSADLAITKTNTPSVNAEIDQSSDGVVKGAVTSYTLIVTNNGPDAMTGAIVTDIPVAGITCPASDPVNLSGAGAPAGSFTFGDLSSGITLATLNVGDQTTIVVTCTVD